MAERLDEIEARLQDIFDSLPDDEKTSFTSGQITASLGDWAGAVQDYIRWRNEKSHHGTGSSIDVNVNGSPYIATRTGSVFGGEASNLVGRDDMRRSAVEVYDRAANFRLQPFTADVSTRGPSETHGEVYDRFERVSTALRQYFGLAFRLDGPAVFARVPIANAENASVIWSPQFRIRSARSQTMLYRAFRRCLTTTLSKRHNRTLRFRPKTNTYRFLRDYELARIPMVIGKPSLTPQRTRNPIFGFINLRREVIVAMCDEGSNQLRWGICDFGPAANGDTGHFDLGINDPHPELL